MNGAAAHIRNYALAFEETGMALGFNRQAIPWSKAIPRYVCKRCSTAISEAEHTQGDSLCVNCRQSLDPGNRQ